MVADEGERALAQVLGRGRPDEVAQERLGTGQPTELLRAAVAARQVTDDRRGHRGVARHQPVQPAGFDGCQLELLENVFVVHGSPRDGQRSGPAISAGAR